MREDSLVTLQPQVVSCIPDVPFARWNRVGPRATRGVANPSFALTKYPHRIPALQYLMGAPALFPRVTVSLRVDVIELLHESGQRQLAIAVLGPLLHGYGLHACW